MRKLHLGSLTLACLIASAASLASPVTWHITGETTFGNEGNFFFPFVTSPGDAVAVDLTFESSVGCSYCDATKRIYEGAVQGIKLTVRDTVFELPVNEASFIEINDDTPSTDGDFFIDSFLLGGYGTADTGIFFSSFFALQNTAVTTPVAGINDLSLASILPPNFSSFSNPEDSWFDFGASFDGGSDGFEARYTSISVVPEPPMSVLLLSGLAIVGFAGFMGRRVKS